jgi:hypothetical protein
MWPSRVTTKQGQEKRGYGLQAWGRTEISSDSVKSLHLYGESGLGSVWAIQA